jgi:bifunctional non-homologous end joining protein LigD
VQKHAARRLHYDFRLELDGALKSWAVPKGIPTAKGDKRLAVMVEDHPLEYADFEGIIPRGQYGAGTVMVWDTGTYEPLSENARDDLDKGKLHFVLQGQKLKGEWVLVRIRSEEGNQWLLMKSGADSKPVSGKEEAESAVSGRTMESIAKSPEAQWQSNQTSHASHASHARLHFLEPMKAKVVESPPRHGDWIYELKFDGYRALALKEGREVRLLSRNNKDLGGKFPEVVDAVSAMDGVEIALLDGEVVALDEQGRSSFQLLQALETEAERPPIFYYLFDLLQDGESSLLKVPLSLRKDRLREICNQSGNDLIRFSDQIGGDPLRLLEQVKKLGLEGIVGKQAGSCYEPGRRSGAWIKIKTLNEQEFVIGGFTPPGGSRDHFGSVLVGYYQGEKLRFAGKVGTGFSEALLADLHGRFLALKRGTCPFEKIPAGAGDFTPAERRRSTWIEPNLVCQVKFTEWTRDGRLRQPVFLGLRGDKDPKEVIRE